MASAKDPNAMLWYRNLTTGLVEMLPSRLGGQDPNLEEVLEGTKPLAYTPIPHEAVEQLRARSAGATSANKKR